MKQLMILFLILGLSPELAAQVHPVASLPLRYDVRKAASPPKIDGNPDPAWDQAPWSACFVDIEGNKRPNPPYKTRVKMLWDDSHLYMLAQLEEPHLWGTLTARDAIIYRDQDFEVFLDPNNDQQQYFEYEVNTLGTVMDLFMNKPYKMGGHADLQWNSVRLQSAVALKGTLNDNRDRDTGWMVEMAIPFKDLERPGRISHPKTGHNWRINFSRVQWTPDMDGKSYRKRKNRDGKFLNENNWVWSPQGLVDMHQPQFWGILHFIN